MINRYRATINIAKQKKLFIILLSSGLAGLLFSFAYEGRWLSVIAVLLFGAALIYLLKTFEQYEQDRMDTIEHKVHTVFGQPIRLKASRMYSDQMSMYAFAGEKEHMEKMVKRDLMELLMREMLPFVQFEEVSDHYGNPLSKIVNATLTVVQWDQDPVFHK